MKALIASSGIAALLFSFVTIAPSIAVPTVDANQAAGVGVVAAPAAVVDVQQQQHKPFFTDAQLDSIRSIKDKYAVDNATKRAEVGVLRHQLFAELAKPTVDRGAVLAIQGKINGLRDELGNNKANFLVDAANVLTPEQRAEAHHRMLHFGFHHRHHGGHGTQGHQCGGQCSGGHGGAHGHEGLRS